MAQIVDDRFIYETQEEHDHRIERENLSFQHQKKRSRNKPKNVGIRRELTRRSGDKCEICSYGFSRTLVVHHILPVSWGGSADTSNLAYICPNCHALVHNYNHYPDRLTVAHRYPGWKQALTKKAGLSVEQADRLLLIASKRARFTRDGSVVPHKERDPLTPIIVDDNGNPVNDRHDPAKIEAALRRIEGVFGTDLDATYVGENDYADTTLTSTGQTPNGSSAIY